MDTLEVLKGLRKIFRHKNRWTKNELYTTALTKKLNAPTHPMQFNKKTVKNDSGKDIYQLCVVGGINLICNTKLYNRPNPTFSGHDTNSVARALGFYGDSSHDQLVNWNNSLGTTYKQFMSRINKAINKLENFYGSD